MNARLIVTVAIAAAMSLSLESCLCGCSSPAAPTPTTSNLAFTFSANPVHSIIGQCNGINGSEGSPPNIPIWLYKLTITNSSPVPFIPTDWTITVAPVGLGAITTVTHETNAAFQAFFNDGHVAGNSSVSGQFCTWLATGFSSGTLEMSFTGADPNGTFTTPTLTLAQ
jgi:hypothetical protein